MTPKSGFEEAESSEPALSGKALFEQKRSEIMQGWKAAFEKLPSFKGADVVLAEDKTLNVKAGGAYMRIEALEVDPGPTEPFSVRFSLYGYNSKSELYDKRAKPSLRMENVTQEEIEQRLGISARRLE